LHVAWNPRNEVAVARVTQAKIDSGNVEAIGDDLLKLAAEVGNRKLLINMEGVEFIFSTALGKLLATEKKITGQGGRLRLCRLCPLVLDTFQKSGLTFVFEIYRDEEHGLAGW
jgi:anti-anti-sigma factor